MRANVVSVIVATLVVLSITQSLGAGSAVAGTTILYVPHDPIVISGNSGFLPENGVVSGDGTEPNPYIIEGWEFDSVAGNGIYIENTDAHAVVRGNSIHDTGGSGGIELWNCVNIDIVNNTIYNNSQDAIFLAYSHDLSVRSNNISGNQDGITVITSTNIEMDNNILSHDCINIGWSSATADLSSHTITTSNLVNGNPVYYYKDSNGLVVDGMLAGEVIIVNSAGVEVTNVESSTLFLAYVEDAHIHHNNLTGGCNGIYLRGVSNTTVNENNVSDSERAGIDVLESTATTIAGNSVSGSGWCGINVDDSDVTISDNTVNDNDYVGISVHFAHDTDISGNQLSGNFRHGIEVWQSISVRVEGNSASLSGVAGAFVGYSLDTTLTGNDFSYNSMHGISIEEKISGISITNNNLSSNGECGISSICWSYETTDNVTIAENNIALNGQYGMYLEYTDDVSVCGNFIDHNGLGIMMTSCEFSNLTGNLIQSNSGDGVRLSSSNYNNIFNNTCSHNSARGIDLEYSDDNVVFNNTCSFNIASGITTYYCADNTLSHNLCVYNGDNGIHLYTSSYTTVSNNTCSNNAVCGIDLYGGFGHANNYNDITWNHLDNNSGYGVSVRSSSGSNNQIWNNTFYHNNGAGDAYDSAHIQAYDGGSSNAWNTASGYGNYWSDWTGPDNDVDGVVDLPYNISGSAGAKDHYPLTMMPTEPIPEFGALPLAVIGFLATLVVALRARHTKSL